MNEVIDKLTDASKALNSFFHQHSFQAMTELDQENCLMMDRGIKNQIRFFRLSDYRCDSHLKH
jgi:hypothetical protein